jgi:hypothetical protein
MRNPVRSETDAFYLTYGGVALAAAAIALGALLEPLAGVALVAGAVIGGLVWEVATKDPDRRRPLREAASEGERVPHGGRRRVLVIANRTLAGDELRAELRRRAGDGAELHVVAPILCSRVHYIATDVDSELAEARDRLSVALDWLRGEGFEAGGKVGDPLAAFGAIEDELRLFGADEVIISTYAHGRSNWLETGIVERLREELEVPVTHVVVEREPAAAG